MDFLITTAGWEIAVISFALMMMSSLVRRAVVDKDKMLEAKEKMKKNQQLLKEATKSGDSKKAKKAQDEMMTHMMDNMKHSFKPMMYTMIPFLLVFSWIQRRYAEIGIVATVFGIQLGWFGWYFICSMLVSMVLNKMFGNY
ncbi:MAG: EMC3/TMCO1 family protein [Candidatus Altiarchaeota archaeon]